MKSEARAEPTAVLDFWFGAPGSTEHGSARRAWFAKDSAFDAEIRERFAAPIEQALRGELDDWGDERRSALAQVLLLDQFTRNAFRGTPRAFAGDPRALAAATRMVGLRQDEAIRLLTRLAAADPAQQSMLDYAQRHRKIIERFGRFPHRNAILGRRSTAEELEVLRRPASGF